MPLRIVMMGTGTFALPTFEAVIESEHEVVGLFTQPDRTGRGHHRHAHPMKERAAEDGIPVFQPAKINEVDAQADLAGLNADLAIVAAYGQILSKEIIQTPRLGSINLHASLLPKYRGAAPVQYSIWKGEPETGVTIFQIEPKLDAGLILGVVKTPIGPKETSGELADRLSRLSVPLALDVVNALESGQANGELQDISAVTKAPRLKKTDGLIDWSESAEQVDWRVRAMQPWPKASTNLKLSDGRSLRLIVLDVDVLSSSEDDSGAEPGTIVQTDSNSCVVACQSGHVSLKKVQPEGKRAMDIEEFLRGNTVAAGDTLSSTSD